MTIKKIFNWKIYLSRLSDYFGWTLPVVAKTFWGDKMKVILPDGVSAAIFCYERYDNDLTWFLEKELKRGDIFLDVGAHYGYFSLLGAHLVGDIGQVHVFEPTPHTFNVLSENCFHKKNIFLNQKAAWKENGSIDFFDLGINYPAGNSYKLRPGDKKEKKKFSIKKIVVSAISLDDYCLEKKIKPTFIKLDAEQAEFKILQGMSRILRDDKPIIAMETWGWEDAIENYREAINLLLKANYEPYLIIENNLVKYQPVEPYLFVNLIFKPL